MKILKDADNKAIGFIEYVPAAHAWRPIHAPGFMFIHCMYIYGNQYKNQGYGSQLLKHCEAEAKAKKMAGVCAMTSKGTWIIDGRLFEKNGYAPVDQRDRFDLYSKKWDVSAVDPKLLDWTAQQKKYQGWQLLYANQCPWHEKSVNAIKATAEAYGIDIKVKKINSAKEARKAPSGFGVFSLLKDGKLLEDHYISATRFKNILEKELHAS